MGSRGIGSGSGILSKRCLPDFAARRAGFMSHFEEIFPRHRSTLIKGEQHFPHEGAPEEMIAAIRDWWPGNDGDINNGVRPVYGTGA